MDTQGTRGAADRLRAKLRMNPSAPSISVILPTRDSARYLDTRIRTIREQSVSDWEVIAIDGESTDGTLATLSEWARGDPRVRVESRRPDGIYPAINRGLELARGEFIYIATSDDTMEPPCLEALRTALREHPECGIAQCCLEWIDENGASIPDRWKSTGTARYLGAAYLQAHLRRAPLDGVLHAAIHTVYHSLTQILVRKRVFAATGPFPLGYGPAGDFCWGAKAGLHADVVHVPRFLATWRCHPAQASAGYRQSARERGLVLEMLRDAFRQDGGTARRLPIKALLAPCLYQQIRYEYAEAGGAPARLRYLAALALRDPIAALRLLASGRRREPDPVLVARALVARCGLERNLEMLPPRTAAPRS